MIWQIMLHHHCTNPNVGNLKLWTLSLWQHWARQMVSQEVCSRSLQDTSSFYFILSTYHPQLSRHHAHRDKETPKKMSSMSMTDSNQTVLNLQNADTCCSTACTPLINIILLLSHRQIKEILLNVSALLQVLLSSSRDKVCRLLIEITI